MFSPPSRFRPSFYHALYGKKYKRCFLKGDDHVESRDYAKLSFALKKPFRIECCALVDGGGMIAGRLIRQDNKPAPGPVCSKTSCGSLFPTGCKRCPRFTEGLEARVFQHLCPCRRFCSQGRRIRWGGRRTGRITGRFFARLGQLIYKISSNIDVVKINTQIL